MWNRFVKQGLSPAVVDTISHSLSAATQRQYRSSFNQWASYCDQFGIDPYDISPVQVTSFFQHLFETKILSYNSFVAHRAALSLVSAHDLAESPLLTRYMRGLFRRRPSTPKHQWSWDPNVVLSHLDSVNPVTLIDFSKKLLTLMLLASGHRLQTMAAIQVQDVHFVDQGVTIWINSLLKTSRPGSKSVSLHLPALSSRPNLCIPSLLRRFISWTEKIRPQNEKSLFIITTPPHSAASTPTLARWTKDTLQASGIDISKFSAHSTHHSAVSSAARKGIPTDNILKAVGWTPSSEMFARVYNHPMQDPFEFSRAVLS